VLAVPGGYAMLVSPKKDETAAHHGCHCRGDMAVRMVQWYKNIHYY